jgi:hypothetical protein
MDEENLVKMMYFNSKNFESPKISGECNQDSDFETMLRQRLAVFSCLRNRFMRTKEKVKSSKVCLILLHNLLN